MQITPIRNFNINPKCQINKKTDVQKYVSCDKRDLIQTNYYLPLNFTARKEYKDLNDYYEVRASTHFRRGLNYGGPSSYYKDVEDTLKMMYDNKRQNKILVVGVGEGQEPFSLAASVYGIKWYENLKDVLDMECVDLGPKLTKKQITEASKMNQQCQYYFAIDSYKKTPDGKYTFIPEICDFVNETLNSKEKTKWDTSIQEFVKDCPENSYDCISMNNVLGYIMSKQEKNDVISKMEKMIKPNGFLITDEIYSEYFKNNNLLTGFDQVFPGIYQKRG